MGVKSLGYSAVPHGGVEWLRYTAFGRIPYNIYARQPSAYFAHQLFFQVTQKLKNHRDSRVEVLN